MISGSGFRISACPGGQIWNLQSGARDLLCITQTSEQVPQNDGWLTDGERAVAAGLRVPKRRADWRLGRWTAKQAILAFQNLNDSVLPSIEIRATQDGSPAAFFNGKPASVSISISHSRDRSFCLAALEDLAVGCDLEWIEVREKSFATDYFTAEELAFVLQLRNKREMAETLIWSAKEAALKVIRKGLTWDTRSIVIRPVVGGPDHSWQGWVGECRESSMIFRGLWRSANGFVYTIATS